MIVKCVEGVEEGFLCLVLALQKLNVINKQDIDIPVLGLKFSRFIVLNCIDEIVREFFRRHISHLKTWLEGKSVVTNCVQ